MSASFVTAVLCIDRRFRRCLVEWLLAHFGADYVDLFTEPGPDRLLAEDAQSIAAAGVQSRLAVSLAAHRPTAIVIAGHHDCAGNPVSPEVHHRHERAAVRVLRRWHPDLPVLGLHVDASCAIHIVGGGEPPSAGRDPVRRRRPEPVPGTA